MTNDKPKVDLNIYLAKEDCINPSNALKEPDSLQRKPLDLGLEPMATLFIRSPQANPPKWAKFFQDHVDLDVFGHNSSTGAVLLVPVKNRTFLLSFGTGWHSIDSAKIESDFGLKTALNLLDPHSIRSIDKTSLEAQPRQLREQSGRATELQYFGIDIERDLLRAVTGKPKDTTTFGTRVSGLDALKLTMDLEPEYLPDLMIKLLSVFGGNEYKNGPFAWIDHIGQVRDLMVNEELNKELVQKINERKLDKIWLSVPEIVDWSQVAGFRYFMSKRSPRIHDVRVLDFLETFESGTISMGNLLSRKIYCVDADDNQILDRPAYNYLYAEIPKEDHVFLLNNGKWYKVQDDYVEGVNQSFNAIPTYDKQLPVYDDDNEGAYNSRVAEADPQKYALLDKNLANVPGAASPIEICDLYRKVKEFIHVKRYGGSGVLSHLFNQGLVSGELFQMSPVYREIVNQKLPADQKFDNSSYRPKPEEFRVIYAIVSENPDPLSLPFFSKVSLKHCASYLQAMGFVVQIAKIDVDENRKLLKRYAPAPDKI